MTYVPKCQIRDPNTLRAKYIENSWTCYLATIANYDTVGCGPYKTRNFYFFDNSDKY